MLDNIRNSENPINPLKLTPKQFEDRVNGWLRRVLNKEGIKAFTIEQQGIEHGAGGQYKIDSLVRITLFRESVLVILAECKHQKRPVSRDEVLALHGKRDDIGAHKGMLFSTSGFQSGAILFAEEKGIATITVSKGAYLYQTKMLDDAPVSPSVNLPEVVGIFRESNGSFSAFFDDCLEQLDKRIEAMLGRAG